MNRYSEGDEKAFDELHAAIAPRLKSYFLARTRNAEDAEELVFETLERMHKAKGRWIPGSRVMPWALKIGNNLLIDQHRAGARRRKTFSDLEAPAEPVDHDGVDGEGKVRVDQLMAALDAELNKLPESQREAFKLVKLAGLSLEETSEILGTSESGIKSLVHRAATSVRRALDHFRKGALT